MSLGEQEEGQGGRRAGWQRSQWEAKARQETHLIRSTGQRGGMASEKWEGGQILDRDFWELGLYRPLRGICLKHSWIRDGYTHVGFIIILTCGCSLSLGVE